eukprot:GEZU01015989.1.p1 GENE.GEZU01015989.1~~GEZU01015989.1.p1  ORF type:complete len:550 (-),score=123.94 GEZU01015989.1:44-1693(-)
MHMPAAKYGLEEAAPSYSFNNDGSALDGFTVSSAPSSPVTRFDEFQSPGITKEATSNSNLVGDENGIELDEHDLQHHEHLNKNGSALGGSGKGGKMQYRAAGPLYKVLRFFFEYKARVLILVFVVGLVLSAFIALIAVKAMRDKERIAIITDPLERAKALHKQYPLIDGHNDFPFKIRYKDNLAVSRVDMYANLSERGYHTNIPRLREGGFGGVFWSIFVPCSTLDKDAVKRTLEQIDVVQRMVASYSNDFQWALAANDITTAFKNGKIASLMGLKGGHSIDNSIGALRVYYSLGVRYMALTYNCNLQWVDSCEGPAQFGDDGGLNEFGVEIVAEMNRLGMMVDLSHTSHAVMRRVLAISKAPVIFSHSSTWALCQHRCNVPDDILVTLAQQNRGIVMINFYPHFVACGANATLSQVADHVDHVKDLVGIDYIGIGTNYDGIEVTPRGLEDTSKVVELSAELFRRGYSDEDVAKIIGGNILRVMREVEAVSAKLNNPSTEEDDADEDDKEDEDGADDAVVVAKPSSAIPSEALWYPKYGNFTPECHAPW